MRSTFVAAALAITAVLGNPHQAHHDIACDSQVTVTVTEKYRHGSLSTASPFPATKSHASSSSLTSATTSHSSRPSKAAAATPHSSRPAESTVVNAPLTDWIKHGSTDLQWYTTIFVGTPPQEL